MEKIVIIGSAGAGKTTLARKLYSILNFKVVHLDRVFWQPGWKEKPRDTRIDILEKIVRDQKWIIEGTYLSSSEPRLNAADTIIFLDIHLSICLLRIFKRYRPFLRLRGLIIKQQRECEELKRRDLPEGCVDKLTLLCILKVLFFPLLGRRTLIKKLNNYKSKQIIWLHSTKEIESFLAQLEPQTNKKKKFSKTRFVAGKRQLAKAR